DGVRPLLRAYDIARAEIGSGEADADRPETVVLAGPPEAVGRARGRRVERYLKQLVHPKNRPLLGFVGPAVPYWTTLEGDKPSVSIVEPESSVVVTPSRRCVFRWQGFRQELPLARGARASEQGRRLVVELTPPHDGH